MLPESLSTHQSPDFVPDLSYPPLPVEVPLVLAEYPEYLMPSDVEAPLEDQPLPADASPTALSPGYVADSDPDEDPEEDPEEDHTDYPVDGGDGDDEPYDNEDDDDTDDEDEEPFEVEDDDEEEEHLAPANSYVVPIVDPVPSAGDTKAFETDESAPTPISPQTKVPFTQTRLCRARKTVRFEPPMSPSMEARITEYAAIPLPPLPPPPLSLHLPSPVPISLPLPSSPLPPLSVSLFIPPPVDYREDIPKAELPTCKRSRYEVGESSTAAPRPTGGHRADYRDVWVDPTEAVKEVAPTTLEGVNARVTKLAAVQRADIQDTYVVIEDTQDRQTQLFQSVDGLVEDMHFYYETARLLDQEALVSREAWAHSVGLSSTASYDASNRIILDAGLPYRLIGVTDDDIDCTCFITIQGHCLAALDRFIALQDEDQALQMITRVMGTEGLVVLHNDLRDGNNVPYQHLCCGEQNVVMLWMKDTKEDVVSQICPRGEIKKMFHEESEEVEKYVGGLPDMIRGNGHFKKDCPKLKNGNRGNQRRNGNAPAKVYVVGNVGTNLDSNVVMGTFLLNDCYASILFDTGADRSFVSTTFSSLIDIIPTTLDHGYDVELADGRIIWVNTLIWGCTLNFLNHPFNIDLMPVEMGSFDVIIGMDWLAKNHVVIVCDEKLVRVPFGDKVLIFHGDESNNRHESRLNIISCNKTQKYLLKGCPIFLAHVTTKKAEDKLKEKRLEDVPIVQDFPEVFP
ncbi:putative reverse transcriptase domain-containing protein, partial [Tanacetum coccineum]